MQYTFQQVFDEYTSQKAMFDSVAMSLVEDVLHGKNGYCMYFLILVSHFHFECWCTTPCLEKNGTNNVLGITLTKFNKFSQFLAQFMLTYRLTKNYKKKDHHYSCTTLNNNDVSLT